MMKHWKARRPAVLALVAAFVLTAYAARVASQPAVSVRGSLPSRLSDVEFWKLVSDISEPGGYFRLSDNFTSNEREIGQLVSLLRRNGTRGGVYLGVGPEQNFTYIAAIHPAMAFIVDIRRQAVMQHLMFKAIFELAEDRADFISLLFSKPRPTGLDRSTAIQKIWDAYWPVASDSAMRAKTYARMVQSLTRTHGFAFTPEESGQLQYVYDAFYSIGPVITTRGAGGGGGGGGGGGRGSGMGVTFADLTGYSTDSTGEAQSFLSSDENYAYVKALEEKNLIVPVSGDFAGPKAIRGIGAWLHEHGGTVSAFYVSNVEQYLFQDGKQGAFYDNVATLPANDSSVFIRPYSMRRFGATQPLCPITPFLAAVREGRIYSNGDALACSR